MAKRLKWNEVSLDDDIRYRGPISFQGFQALSWLCMVVAVALALLEFAGKVDQPTAEMTKDVLPVLRTVSSLTISEKTKNADTAELEQLLLRPEATNTEVPQAQP